MWKVSRSSLVAVYAMMENTMDAAPLKPDHETSSSCFILLRNGVSTSATERGLATKVSHINIKSAGTMTCGSFDGKESRPSRKKISICMSPVMPSKKFTRFFLFSISVLPSIMPTI